MKNRGEPFSLSRKSTSNFTMVTDKRDIILLVSPTLSPSSQSSPKGVNTAALVKNSFLKEYKALFCPKVFLLFQKFPQVAACSVRAN